MQRIQARVEGGVQGVGFRYHTLRHAQDLGLSGWVRNLPDGSVELEAQGPEKAIHKFLEFLERGPSAARVSRVTAHPRPVEAEESGFQIR